MVTYVLDTNTCIAAIRNHARVIARMMEVPPEEMAVAVMTVAELWFGALKSADPARGRAVADAFLEPFETLPFDEAAADFYANTRHYLESRGTPIGERDLIIAATALARGLTVVTNNTREFRRVPELRVEDWSEVGRK
jgi:tRNA(fMet)-specific endonuclease VapC